MILTHDKILDAVRAGEIVIDPFDETALDAASYDLMHILRSGCSSKA